MKLPNVVSNSGLASLWHWQWGHLGTRQCSLEKPKQTFYKDGGGLKEKETDRGRRWRRNPQKGWYSGSWIFLFQFDIVYWTLLLLHLLNFILNIFRLKLPVSDICLAFCHFQNHHDWRPVRAQVSFVFRRASRPLEKLNRTDRCCCCALLTITKTFSREWKKQQAISNNLEQNCF